MVVSGSASERALQFPMKEVSVKNEPDLNFLIREELRRAVILDSDDDDLIRRRQLPQDHLPFKFPILFFQK